MRSLGIAVAALFFVCLFSARAQPQTFSSCAAGARTFYPCELSFTWKDGELPANFSSDKDELLHMEFRSPSARTFLIRAYPSSLHTLTVRFSPTEPGAWTTRTTSGLKQYDQTQSTFTVADSGHPGFISVANVRHWKTTNKQPHLWLGAELPPFTLDASALTAWLDTRKREGYTHIRTTLLTANGSSQPLTKAGAPDPAYFDVLDSQLIEIANRGFTLDLVLADESFLKTGALSQYVTRQPLVQYVVARYGALNLTWQGIARFDTVPGGRELLSEVSGAVKQLDAYAHPLSSDAAVSSSPLLQDGWMNFLVEASPHPEVGAVEHQFTQSPQVHLISSTSPKAFRAELWNATANGEYPSASFDSLKNEANSRAVQVWQKIMVGTRHWEFEPYFDVSGARCAGLDEVEYVAYAQQPGIVEVSLPRHKYNPLWVNPATGEDLELKNYRGEVFSQQTPDNEHDWILQVPRNGQKESMRSYRFESADPPIQEVENDSTKLPFSLSAPAGNELSTRVSVPFQLKLTKNNRSTRSMQYLWWGEVTAGGEGPRLLAIGPSGQFTIAQILLKDKAETLNLKVQAINANGKAFEIDRVYQLR